VKSRSITAVEEDSFMMTTPIDSNYESMSVVDVGVDKKTREDKMTTNQDSFGPLSAG
jgi:hypothetical protein